MQRQTNICEPEEIVQTHTIDWACAKTHSGTDMTNYLNTKRYRGLISTSAYTHALLYTHTHTQSHTPPPPAPVTQYDFLQIPKSDPGWNISARLPRHFASANLPLSFSFFPFRFASSEKATDMKMHCFQSGFGHTKASGPELIIKWSSIFQGSSYFAGRMDMSEALERRSSGE